MIKTCKKHGEVPYLETVDKGKPRWYCPKCNYESVATRRKTLKKRLLNSFGGRCSRCGYNKSTRALSFHHLDPSKKEFELSLTTVIGWERLQKEAEKCVLLCANCHAEEHEEQDICAGRAKV